MKQNKIDPYYRKRRWNHRSRANQNRKYRPPENCLTQQREAGHIHPRVKILPQTKALFDFWVEHADTLADYPSIDNTVRFADDAGRELGPLVVFPTSAQATRAIEVVLDCIPPKVMLYPYPTEN